MADFHRNLIAGGVFLYPGDTKNAQGKLRLLYEANPMAYLVEAAGGKATDGARRILDIQPTDLHQRTPLVIGGSTDVDYVGRVIAGQDVVTAVLARRHELLEAVLDRMSGEERAHAAAAAERFVQLVGEATVEAGAIGQVAL